MSNLPTGPLVQVMHEADAIVGILDERYEDMMTKEIYKGSEMGIVLGLLKFQGLLIKSFALKSDGGFSKQSAEQASDKLPGVLTRLAAEHGLSGAELAWATARAIGQVLFDQIRLRAEKAGREGG